MQDSETGVDVFVLNSATEFTGHRTCKQCLVFHLAHWESLFGPQGVGHCHIPLADIHQRGFTGGHRGVSLDTFKHSSQLWIHLDLRYKVVHQWALVYNDKNSK